MLRPWFWIVVRAIAVVGRDCSHVCGTSALDGVSFRNVSLCSQAGDVLVIGDSTTSRYLEYLDELIWPLGLNVVYTGDGYGRKGSCATSLGLGLNNLNEVTQVKADSPATVRDAVSSSWHGCGRARLAQRTYRP